MYRELSTRPTSHSVYFKLLKRSHAHSHFSHETDAIFVEQKSPKKSNSENQIKSLLEQAKTDAIRMINELCVVVAAILR